MSKIVLILFGALTVGSLWMTYSGTGLQGVKTQTLKPKTVRSTHTGSWSSSSSSGFSFGK